MIILPDTPDIQPRIDVHMLRAGGRWHERLDWYQECMESIRPAIEAGIICLHQIQGYPGHVGRGRAIGFTHGNAPYASFVDPDDIYNPDVFAICADYLDAHPQVGMVYTGEHMLRNDGKLYIRRTPMNIRRVLAEPAYTHGVKVYRREAILPHLGVLRVWTRAELELTRALVNAGSQVAYIDVWGRRWRQHEGQAHRKEQRVRKPPTRF